ncbi:hypothetical protein SpCBS45565_g04703 [Spizellomyces sp. 'palustris']|nr:hypothetical protein SpCBS45565_g04703 [Spizellomyces sp. 'palustris']
MKRARTPQKSQPEPVDPSTDDEEYTLAEIVDDDSASDGDTVFFSAESDTEEVDGINSTSEEEPAEDEGEGDEDEGDEDEGDEIPEGDEDEFSSDQSPEEENEFASSGDDDDEEEDDGTVRVLRKKPLPEIDPVYDEDTSDEETTNTVGNVPKEWYDEFPHSGYTVDGKKILKPVKGDQLDAFLSVMDDPNTWRSVYDNLEDRNIVLTKEELEMIKRIQKGDFPDATSNPYEPTVEWFSSKTQITPLSAAPEPKRRFIPSKWEAQRIMHIVRAIRQGRIVPGKKADKKKLQSQFYSIWDDATEPTDRIMHIPPPKASLPEHEESYNPPEEYLPTEREIEEWEKMDSQDRPRNYVPKKYNNLRSVPGYNRFIQERFDRCLDLYLCPRIIKKKLNIDPESLIPKLPNPRDLQPFPATLAITYKGHTARIRSISIDPTGQYLVSGSDDKTVRLWEIVSGRCLKTWTFDEPITFITWNPNKALSLIALASNTCVYIITPKTASPEIQSATDALISHMWANQSKHTNAEWTKPTDKHAAQGRLVTIRCEKNVTFVTWHRKGDYLATVSPDGASKSILIHQLSKGLSQNPFRKAKGLVQRVSFHPTKPFFFVATQRTVRVYNLQTQTHQKTLQPSTKWISSLSIHPAGDNLIIGTYDKRLSWFDMDLSSKPYKTLRYHKQAIRNVSFHSRYPLFASCGDEGSVNIFHGMVYNDLMMNPLIVPVKTLRAHEVVDGLGALHCEFHPTQPWIFSCGADATIKLFS